MSVTRDDVLFRSPAVSDGYEIWQLISNSPPLDANSVYSYYLLSDHFSDTCVVAEYRGEVTGFLSGYIVPNRPDTLFVWQVVVDKSMRGKGVAWRMLDDLLAREGTSGVRYVEATVNPSNQASRALFERLASDQGTTLDERVYLESSAFGSKGSHDSEILLRIPLAANRSN